MSGASEKAERLRQLFNLGPAVRRLTAIANESADAMLTEGPVSPDHELLRLCGEALHHLVHLEKTRDARRHAPYPHLGTEAEKEAALRLDQQLYEQQLECAKGAKPHLGLIRKIKARTAAGIYAKAMVVRASKTGAADLAMTLAADLLDCPGLRASLWPPEREAQ